MGIIKRCILCILCIVLCIASLVSCGPKNEALSAKEITDIIKSYNSSDIVWTGLKGGDISAYFGFSDEKLTDMSAFINDDDEHFDIAAAFQFESEKDMLAVIETLNKSLIVAEETFDNTSNSEAQKIGNKQILKNGSMLVIVVSGNYEKIANELKNKGFVSVEK